MKPITLNRIGDMLIPAIVFEKETPFCIGVVGTHETCGCHIKLFPATKRYNRLHCECGLAIEIPKSIDTWGKFLTGLRWYLAWSDSQANTYGSPFWHYS